MSAPNGPVYENPSADKFGPPPFPSASEPDGKLQRRLKRIALGLAVFLRSTIRDECFVISRLV
jgi:hypothetical protein